MIDNIIKNIYVGIDIKKSKELLDFQFQVCSQLNLIHRKELHITIAYFDEISELNLIKLGNSLRPLFSNEIKEIKISGIGGAFQKNQDEIKIFNSINLENFQTYPRVLWWTINQSDALINFRNSLISIAFSLNLSKTYLRPTFFPHITIGSGGNNDENEKWSRWDTQVVDKLVTINDLFYSRRENFNKMHITNSIIHPESLFIINE